MLSHLQRSHPQLLTTPALSNLRQVVDKALKDVSGVQVTVIVHIDVHHALGIWRAERTVFKMVNSTQRGDNALSAVEQSSVLV